MATVREGSKGVLLVVDVQVDVVKAAWENERVVGNVARAVGRARDQKVPVIWVQHADEGLKVALWLHVAAHHAEAHLRFAVARQKGRDDGVERPLAGRH